MESETYLNAYENYRRTSRINSLQASNLGTAVLELMTKTPRWEGTATELIGELNVCLPPTTSRKHFPSSARAMSGALRRIIPNLKEVGIEVDLPEGARRTATGKVARTITLTSQTWQDDNSKPIDGDLFSI